MRYYICNTLEHKLERKISVEKDLFLNTYMPLIQSKLTHVTIFLLLELSNDYYKKCRLKFPLDIQKEFYIGILMLF